MTLKRMDNVLIVVDDLEAVKAFFLELGLELEGESTVEGPLVGNLIGLKDVRATVLVADAICPDPFSKRRVSVRDAAAAIVEYRRSTGDASGTVDLMLAFVEAATKQAADLGYGDEAYSDALQRCRSGWTPWRRSSPCCPRTYART
jgi:hypothetical protein